MEKVSLWEKNEFELQNQTLKTLEKVSPSRASPSNRMRRANSQTRDNNIRSNRAACLGIYHSVSALFVAFIASLPNEFSPSQRMGRIFCLDFRYINQYPHNQQSEMMSLSIVRVIWQLTMWIKKLSCSTFVGARRVGDFDYSLHHSRVAVDVGTWF